MVGGVAIHKEKERGQLPSSVMPFFCLEASQAAEATFENLRGLLGSGSFVEMVSSPEEITVNVCQSTNSFYSGLRWIS